MADVVIVLEHRQAAAAPSAAAKAELLQLPLTAHQRTVMRGRRRTSCGLDVLLQLPREGSLQPGERLVDGTRTRQVVVVAAEEELLRVQAASPLALLQAAYHLGNRHVSLELHEHELLLLDDAVLATMLAGLGLTLSRCRRPFLPEGGAYAGHSHRHGHEHVDSEMNSSV